MEDGFTYISDEGDLSADSRRELDETGFVVIPDAIGSEELSQKATAYDSLLLSASPQDIRVGSTTTRVGLAYGGPEFDSLCMLPTLLAACRHIIGQPIKLSSFHVRTLHPRSQAQRLHIDFRPGEERFPLAGFIYMIDDFRADNGATGFLPGSHRWPSRPDELTDESLTEFNDQIQTAVGRAGSLIVFHGSIWHEHTANLTDAPRRSIQGAFIPRDAPSAV